MNPTVQPAQAPPEGIEVEVLAITMAAALGLPWNSLDADGVAKLRICANAALIRLGLDGRVKGAARLAEVLAEGADALRTAAQVADHHKVEERLIKRIYRGATAIETAGAALGVMAQYEVDEEAV